MSLNLLGENNLPCQAIGPPIVEPRQFTFTHTRFKHIGVVYYGNGFESSQESLCRLLVPQVNLKRSLDTDSLVSVPVLWTTAESIAPPEAITAGF